LATSQRAFFGAIVAGALDDKSMIFDPEPMRSCNLVPKPNDIITCEFDEFSALSAVQVIVFGISVVQLVHASTVEFEAVEESCVDEFLEGSVDGWSGNVIRRTTRGKLLNQQISVEMLVPIKYLFEKELLLRGISQSAGLQELLVAFERSH
jgi:hypothetical protein